MARIHVVRERSAFSIMMRVHVGGEIAMIADVASITYAVYPEAGGTVVATGTLTVDDVMFDTLQTDSRWEEDATGYNFRHEVGHTVLTSAAKFVVEYKYTCGATVFFAPRVVIRASDIYTP